MIYSKWNDSRWYTYWDVAKSGDSIGEQVFTVRGIGSINFAQIKESPENCLRALCERDEHLTGDQVSDKEKSELYEYIMQFIEEVEDGF